LSQLILLRRVLLRSEVVIVRSAVITQRKIALTQGVIISRPVITQIRFAVTSGEISEPKVALGIRTELINVMSGFGLVHPRRGSQRCNHSGIGVVRLIRVNIVIRLSKLPE